MKTFIFVAASLLLLQGQALSQTLNVHEWGTFTTLHRSTGGTLSGLYYEEEQLPPFVYHLPGFAPGPSRRQCNNVTVKMETPVLYFYSEIERKVQVHVDFPMGTISQWYPNRSGGEEMQPGVLDLAEYRQGSIDWNATVLAPTTNEVVTQRNVSNFHKWTDPRNTSSNLVKNDSGEVEKYLFYRGLANFPLPLDVSFIDSVHLLVKNTSEFEIPFIYIYDHTSSGSAGIWGIGPLRSGEIKVFSPPKKYYYEDENVRENDTFQIALQKAGLTKLEAQSMLKTWTDGYFQTVGFKVFWIVPRTLTDNILPLRINPTPDSIERVIVGKTEVLTPMFERKLLANYKAGKMANYSSDRYRLAYLQRAMEMKEIEDAIPKPLTVHEYGLLTSLHGSTGISLSNLEKEPIHMPDFVYHFPGFSPDSSMMVYKNDPVRLERPVMNFYSNIERPIKVGIDFPMGSITQWYPSRAAGENAPDGDTVDVSDPRRGSIQWKATILGRKTEEQLTNMKSNWIWEMLRESESSLLKNEQGEIEKFLSYQGLANFALPVEIKFLDSENISVTNTSDKDIPSIYIYGSSDLYYYRVIGPLLRGERRIMNIVVPGTNVNYDLPKAFRSSGLTEKEASFLANSATIDLSKSSNIKALCIIPRELTDRILPLWFNPWPDTLQRVFASRTEILTPAFEKLLLDYYTKNGNLDEWKDDPYLFAYLERVKQIYKPKVITEGVRTANSPDEIMITPNPVSTKAHILSTSDISSIEVHNVLGETVMEEKNLYSPDFTLDLSKLVPGTYYIRFYSANSVATKKIIKN